MRTLPIVTSQIGESAAWAAALNNDGNAFAAVFDLHRDRVYHHALRVTTSVHDAEDVTAAAFFELWRRKRSVRLVNDSVLPWLLVTTTNLARNLNRGLRRYRALLTALPRAIETRSAEDVAVEQMERERLALRLREALGALTPADAALITLVALERFSSAQTAVALGISEGAVRARLLRVRRRIASTLDALEAANNDNSTREEIR